MIPQKLANLEALLTTISLHARPSFLIIGAQKSGTSALYTYLTKHPHIKPPRLKEINFFNQEAHYHRGLLWYHIHFPDLSQMGSQAITFEATPDYFYHPQVAARIYRYDPRLKLIVLLRHPVERAYSEWNMHRLLFAGQLEPYFLQLIETIRHADTVDSSPLLARINPEMRLKKVDFFLNQRLLPFEVAVRQEIKQMDAGETRPYPHYVHCGLYAQQLRRYLSYFDRQQMHIIDSRQLRTNPVPILRRVTWFLRLPEHDWRQENLVGPQAHYREPLDQEIRQWLHAFYQPHNEQLYELVGHDFGWQ